MISLCEKLKQCLIIDSLFDDEDVMLNNVDKTAYNADIVNFNSLFRKSFKIQDNNKDVISNVAAYIEDEDIFINHDLVTHVDDIPINNFYNNIKRLNVGGVLRCIGGSNELTDKTIIKNIVCGSLITHGKSKFKNLHILCTKDIKFKKGEPHSNFIQNISFQTSLENKEFDNVFIKILSNSYKTLYINSLSIPVFNNLRSNCDEIVITGVNIFKNANKKLNNFFNLPIKCNIKEYGVDKEIFIKNFNTFKTLGNYKYTITNDEFLDLVSNSKLVDLIDISKCPYLKCIKIQDYEHVLQFDKGDKKYDNKNILNPSKNIYTKDRWRLSLYKIN